MDAVARARHLIGAGMTLSLQSDVACACSARKDVKQGTIAFCNEDLTTNSQHFRNADEGSSPRIALQSLSRFDYRPAIRKLLSLRWSS